MKSLSVLPIVLWFACDAFHAREPKQRDDWSAPPAKYGDTQFNGLQAPGQGRAADAGVNTTQ
jgi:hypothetical protein